MYLQLGLEIVCIQEESYIQFLRNKACLNCLPYIVLLYFNFGWQLFRWQFTKQYFRKGAKIQYSQPFICYFAP